ncbi:MarR family transcriptional regulator [Nonomuraea rubra]|uniref:MarR family transcriptional regulator n=1 Tax=Nonomuraea rubra TaxID=46180 RepID=UPI0031EBCF90
MTMRELTAELSTDKPYTTLMVDDLEQRGYVNPQRLPGDRRTARSSPLTPEGTARSPRRPRPHPGPAPPRSLLAGSQGTGPPHDRNHGQAAHPGS